MGFGLDKLTLEQDKYLNSCARGHGMWFDKGELSAVIRTAEADEDNPLVRFFRELEDDTARD